MAVKTPGLVVADVRRKQRVNEGLCLGTLPEGQYFNKRKGGI